MFSLSKESRSKHAEYPWRLSAQVGCHCQPSGRLCCRHWDRANDKWQATVSAYRSVVADACEPPDDNAVAFDVLRTQIQRWRAVCGLVLVVMSSSSSSSSSSPSLSSSIFHNVRQTLVLMSSSSSFWYAARPAPRVVGVCILDATVSNYIPDCRHLQ